MVPPKLELAILYTAAQRLNHYTTETTLVSVRTRNVKYCSRARRYRVSAEMNVCHSTDKPSGYHFRLNFSKDTNSYHKSKAYFHDTEAPGTETVMTNPATR